MLSQRLSQIHKAVHVSKTWGEINFKTLTFLYISTKPGTNGGQINTSGAFRGSVRELSEILTFKIAMEA